MTTPLHFNAFVMNTNSHIQHGHWRRPEAQQVDFENVDLWIDLARLLEEAKFDAMFFADVTGHYGDADADFEVYARHGLQIPSNDPTVLLGALAVGVLIVLYRRDYQSPALAPRQPSVAVRPVAGLEPVGGESGGRGTGFWALTSAPVTSEGVFRWTVTTGATSGLGLGTGSGSRSG